MKIQDMVHILVYISCHIAWNIVSKNKSCLMFIYFSSYERHDVLFKSRKQGSID